MSREFVQKIGPADTASRSSVRKAAPLRKDVVDKLAATLSASPRAAAKASSSEKTFAERQVEIAAAGSTTKALPTPTREQIEAEGGGVIGYIRAARRLGQFGQ